MVRLDEISKRTLASIKRDMTKDIEKDVQMFRKLKAADDDPDEMLRQSWLYYLLFWLAVLSLVFLSACTPTVKHEIPIADKAMDILADVKSTPVCPTLAMPPLPEECVIDIRGDTMTASSPECESLIRHYVAARQLLRPAAP